MLQTAAVEWHIVSHKGVELVKIQPLYLFPHFRERWRIFSVLGRDAVTPHIPIVVQIIFRLHQPRARFCNLSIAHHANANLANGSPLARGRLEINGYKIQSSAHHAFSS